MEDLVALIAAIVEALWKRGRRGPASPSTGRAPSGADRSSGSIAALLRDAFSARAPGLNAAAAGMPSGAPARLPAASGSPDSGLASAGSAPEFSGTGGAARREAGLVTALFASPQSLVAAFVVAEVLAPPVALRER